MVSGCKGGISGDKTISHAIEGMSEKLDLKSG